MNFPDVSKGTSQHLGPIGTSIVHVFSGTPGGRAATNTPSLLLPLAEETGVCSLLQGGVWSWSRLDTGALIRQGFPGLSQTYFQMGILLFTIPELCLI